MSARERLHGSLAGSTRFPRAVIAVACASFIAAGVAFGQADDGPATVEIRFACESTGCPPPFLVVEGNARAEHVTVNLTEATDEYEVTDAAGLSAQQPSCRSLSATVVRCSPVERRVVVNGRHADDYIAIGPAVTGLAQLQPGPGDDHVSVDRDSAAEAYVEGDTGNDHIRGGASTGFDSLTGIHGDLLVGRPGRDVLRGRRGPDEIVGGPQADEAYGGPGRDRLMMAGSGGGDVDRVINCGRGQDVAYVNQVDPAPINCERIRTGRG